MVVTWSDRNDRDGKHESFDYSCTPCATILIKIKYDYRSSAATFLELRVYLRKKVTLQKQKT